MNIFYVLKIIYRHLCVSVSCHMEKINSHSGVDQDSGVQGHCTMPVLGLHDPEHEGTVLL